MSDQGLQNVEGVAVTLLVVGYVLWFVIHRFRRTRPDFHVGIPIAVAFGLRLAAIATIGSLGLGATLRGGDEITFLQRAADLASQPLGHGDWPHGIYQLHTVVFAMELKLQFLTQGSMRIIQVCFALMGVVLILAAVHDLGGGRSARLAAWLLALDPTSIFFNSALHKEPLMELAAGLVVFGGTRIWRHLDVSGILICALGGVIAVETRSYAGWFLVSAAVFLLLHAALRSLDRPMRALPLISGVAVIAFVATPVVIQASSSKNLAGLQGSQNANTTNVGPSSGPNGNNLALEQVNFSTRGAIFSNLPKRIRDLILRPYPWQLGSISQQFGAIGTLFAYAILLLLIWYAWLSRGQVLARAAPLLYPMLFLLVAYSLSVGNAGTGFRYRSHLVALAVAATAILREGAILARARRRDTALVPREREPATVRTPAASPI